jgi:hypothetical protein
MGMTNANAAKALPAAMVTPFVMTAASVPPVMVSASPVLVSVAAPAPMLDLYHFAIRRGHRGHAQPGGSGYGHCQQRKTNQGDTSHTVSSRSRDCDVRHKFPMERFVPARMK